MKDFSNVKVGDVLTFNDDTEGNWPPDCVVNGHSYKVLDVSEDGNKFLKAKMIAIETESPEFYHESLAQTLMLSTIVGDEFGMRNFCRKGRIVFTTDYADKFSFSRPHLKLVRS